MELDAKHLKHELIFWRRPDVVITQGIIKEGQLVLVPIAPMVNILKKHIAFGSGIPWVNTAGDTNDEFFILPVSKPPLECEDIDEFILAVFWWVSTTPDKKLANMALESITQNGIAVPVLKNSCDLPPYSRLYVWAKPKPKAAAKNIMDGHGEASGVPLQKKHRS